MTKIIKEKYLCVHNFDISVSCICAILGCILFSEKALSLSCPMGYNKVGSDCVRVIDGRSRFPLTQQALDFYNGVVRPCEMDSTKFSNCGNLWYQFQLTNGEIITSPAKGTSGGNGSAPKGVVTDRSDDEDCSAFDDTCLAQKGSAVPVKQVPKQKPKVSTEATKSNPSKSTSGNGSSKSKAESESESTSEPKSDSTTVGSSGGSCYPSDSEQVPGLAMCDSSGKPSCWMSEDQYQSGLPECDAYGKPQGSSTADNGAPDNSTTDTQNTVADGDANMPAGFPQPQEVESDRELCESAHKSANVCCNDPVQCITGLSGPTSSAVSAVGSLLMGATSMMALNGTANSQDAAGIAKSCNLMKMVAMGGTIANTALGAKCYSEKSSCEDKCQEIDDKYRKVLAQCDDLKTAFRSNNSGPLCPSSWYQGYAAAQSAAAGRGKRCTGYNSNVAAMGNQAAQSAAASGFADLCNQAATAQATGFPNIDQQPVFSGDCNDPANASNPICVNCRGTAALTDPLCKGLAPSSNTSSGTSSAFQSPDFGTRAINGSDINVPDTNGQVQDPLFGNGLSAESKSNSVPSNGGSFTGGSGGGGMPFSGGGGGGYGGGPGYDTDILKGLGGGGGYSASPVPTDSRGGYSGGGQANTKRSDNPFDKFDLKKYLPGNNKSGANRGPAGTDEYRRNPEIGGPHEDLFEKIHRRYRIMCNQGRFIGCENGRRL